MKYLCFLMFNLFLFSGNSIARQTDDESHLIYWTEDYRLTYTDFEDLPLRYSENAAFSVLGLKSSFEMTNEEYKADVKSYFEKDSSWTRSWVPILLAHEQGHFDIAELHARKFRKRLKDAMKADELTVSKFENMHEQIIEDLKKAQIEYDNATNYSMDYRAQLDWLERINNELEAMKDYAASEVRVKRN